MPNIIEIRSLDLEEAEREAKRLIRVIAQEQAPAMVMVAPFDRAFFDASLPLRMPVFVINGMIAWEGPHPPRPLVRQWLSWPRNPAEAVDQVLQIFGRMPGGLDDQEFLREAIAERFGLMTGNFELLEACGFDPLAPEVVVDLIITKAREEHARRRRELN